MMHDVKVVKLNTQDIGINSGMNYFVLYMQLEFSGALTSPFDNSRHDYVAKRKQ